MIAFVVVRRDGIGARHSMMERFDFDDTKKKWRLRRQNRHDWIPPSVQDSVPTQEADSTPIVVEAVNGNIKSLLCRGRGYRNLRYLLLKAQRMAVLKTEFLVFRKAA